MRDFRGYICLHRRILLSELEDLNDHQWRMAIRLLFRANWKDGKWFNKLAGKTEIIKRGSFVTSIGKLADEFGTSPRKLRTLMSKLCPDGANFLTIETTNQYTKITIVNYNKYQMSQEEATNQTTKERQANDKRTTTIEEEVLVLNKEPLSPAETTAVKVEKVKEPTLPQWLVTEFYAILNARLPESSHQIAPNSAYINATALCHQFPKMTKENFNNILVKWYFASGKEWWQTGGRSWGHFIKCFASMISTINEGRFK